MRRALVNRIVFKSIGTLSLLLFFSLFVFAGGPGDPPFGTIKGRITTADKKPATEVTIQIKSIKRAVLPLGSI